VHVALAQDSHATYPPESELCLNIWCIVVRISPTSPEVDAPQLVGKSDRKALTAVDDKGECARDVGLWLMFPGFTRVLSAKLWRSITHKLTIVYL
jgi:hypothetical protein